MKPSMNQYFEELYRGTGDLLDKVKQFDRGMRNGEEIARLQEAYSGIEFSRSFHGTNKAWMERAIQHLEQIKGRLLTIMEDLLYSA